jgi:hypothetical protein
MNYWCTRRLFLDYLNAHNTQHEHWNDTFSFFLALLNNIVAIYCVDLFVYTTSIYIYNCKGSLS